jgi:hypothetical protein
MLDYGHRAIEPRSINGIVIGMMTALPVWIAILLIIGIF